MNISDPKESTTETLANTLIKATNSKAAVDRYKSTNAFAGEKEQVDFSKLSKLEQSEVHLESIKDLVASVNNRTTEEDYGIVTKSQVGHNLSTLIKKIAALGNILILSEVSIEIAKLRPNVEFAVRFLFPEVIQETLANFSINEYVPQKHDSLSEYAVDSLLVINSIEVNWYRRRNSSEDYNSTALRNLSEDSIKLLGCIVGYRNLVNLAKSIKKVRTI